MSSVPGWCAGGCGPWLYGTHGCCRGRYAGRGADPRGGRRLAGLSLDPRGTDVGATTQRCATVHRPAPCNSDRVDRVDGSTVSGGVRPVNRDLDPKVRPAVSDAPVTGLRHTVTGIDRTVVGTSGPAAIRPIG